MIINDQLFHGKLEIQREGDFWYQTSPGWGHTQPFYDFFLTDFSNICFMNIIIVNK